MPSFTQNDIQQTILRLRNSTGEDDIVAALDILGAVQWVGAVPDIMAHINDPRPKIKTSVETALLAIGQEAIPAIVEYLPKLEPQYHVSLQSIVESFWKDAGADQIHMMMNHEDNRVRWAMAWTLANPLQTIPPEDIAYIFEGLEDETLTAIRWAATQSLMTLASRGQAIPPQLIQVALPVMVDNFKYGDMNLSESSVQAISLLVSPPHPAITAMLRSSDADLQVAGIKVLSAWVEDGKVLDDETINAFKFTTQHPTWRAENEISRLNYVLSMSNPDVLEQLESPSDKVKSEDTTEDTKAMRSTQEIMLPPLNEDQTADATSDSNTDEDTIEIQKTTAFKLDESDRQPDTISDHDTDEDTIEIQKTTAFKIDEPEQPTDVVSEDESDEDTIEIEKTTAFRDDKPAPNDSMHDTTTTKDASPTDANISDDIVEDVSDDKPSDADVADTHDGKTDTIQPMEDNETTETDD